MSESRELVVPPSVLVEIAPGVKVWHRQGAALHLTVVVDEQPQSGPPPAEGGAPPAPTS